MQDITPVLKWLEENHFTPAGPLPRENGSPPDELFVQAWEEYIRDIPELGALGALRQRLVQLCFPVRHGMSANPDYLLATRRGISPAGLEAAGDIGLQDPAGLKVYLYQTRAGRIPVLETADRADFEMLVQVFRYRNEPVDIPASLGACMIKGYNNWDRVARYKKKCGPQFDFKQMKARRELYQDTFLIVSDAEYSGVPAKMLGLAKREWRRLSLVIRREHEATHYFTQRFLGSAKNHPLDEFIADYMGIVAAVGRYRADWFLRFMGLENYPEFRQGGRLVNYVENKRLTQIEFDELKSCIKNAAENVEQFAFNNPKVYSAQGRYEMLWRLCGSNLLTLAENNLHNRLRGGRVEEKSVAKNWLEKLNN